MGWTASDNPIAQVRLRFPTLAAAVAYAERQGLDYRVIEPPARRRLRRDISKPSVASPLRRDPAGFSHGLPRGLECPRLKVGI